MRVDVVLQKNSWIEAIVEFKRRVAGAGVLGIVVGKLSHWQEPCLVILLPVHKGSEVCLHCAVLPFYLAIGLRMESHRESSFDSQEIA